MCADDQHCTHNDEEVTGVFVKAEKDSNISCTHLIIPAGQEQQGTSLQSIHLLSLGACGEPNHQHGSKIAD